MNNKIINKKKTGIWGIFVLGCAVLFASCLKKSIVPPASGTSGSNNVIMFLDNGGTGAQILSSYALYPLYNFFLPLPAAVGDTAGGFNLLVYYGPVGTAPQDITVQLAVDSAALVAFDSANGGEDNGFAYTMPDGSIYTFPSSVTIPKGQNLAIAHVTVTQSASFDFDASYALPVTITSSSYGTVSSNYSTSINNFLIVNILDGVYNVTGTFSSTLSSAYSGAYPKTVTLATADPSSDYYMEGGYYQYNFMNGSASSYFGNFDPVFSFDLNGNITAVTNAYNDPAPRSRQAQLDPSGVNKYYPHPGASYCDSINVSYFMLQSGAIANRITEHFVYESSR